MLVQPSSRLKRLMTSTTFHTNLSNTKTKAKAIRSLTLVDERKRKVVSANRANTISKDLLAQATQWRLSLKEITVTPTGKISLSHQINNRFDGIKNLDV